MNYQKLSPLLAALMFEYFKFPDAIMSTVKETRPQPLGTSAADTPETMVFIHCGENAEIENAADWRVISKAGKIRTARVALDKIGGLSEHSDIDYLSCSLRLRPLNDSQAIAEELAKFKENHPALNGADIIFGIINSGVDVSQSSFAERLHGIWDQTLAGTEDGNPPYGKILSGATLTECTDGDGHGTRTATIFADFAAQFGAADEKNIVVVKTDFQNAHLADAVQYIFDAAEKDGKIAVVNVNLDGFFDVRDNGDDFSNFIAQASDARKIVIPVGGGESKRKISAAAKVAPNKFKPAKLYFVVPSNSLPGSPMQVAVRGWIENEGDCEIKITAPDGGVTRSTQPELLAGNPTLLGTYQDSQAFLTKPLKTPDGRREFFIDLRPLAPETLVASGTWTLTVFNNGNVEISVGAITCVPPNAVDAEFVS